MSRLATGIPGLDEVLHGGLPRGRAYLLVGEPGTGKTILAMQWLRAGVQAGERCMYITLAEPVSELSANLTSLGWDLQGIEVVDLSPLSSFPEEGFREYRVFSAGEVEEVPLWEKIWAAVEEKHPQRLVLDPITFLQTISPELYQFRRNFLRLVGLLNSRGITTLLIAEPTLLQEEKALGLAVDGVIKLERTVGPSRLLALRSLEVQKMRGSDYLSGLHPFRITSHGIEVYPHRVFPLSSPAIKGKKLSFGLPELDGLLGGGVEVGTATLLAGPSGVGKSTLGTQFLVNAARQNIRSVLYTFEEHPAAIVARAQGVGLPIEDPLESGALKIMAISPLTLYPDEFHAQVRHDVEREGRAVVMIDSLRGYNVAMEEFGNLVVHTHNLAAYLANRGVTSIWVAETEHIIGELSLTELGVSFVFDNAFLLRYVESWGQITRVLGCLKKRVGKTVLELREFRITSQGLWVSKDPLQIPGFFSGIAAARPPDR